MTARTPVVALALILCGGSLYAADTKNIDRTLPLRATGAVTLDAHNGSIQVRTWDRAEIEVHARIELEHLLAPAGALLASMMTVELVKR